MISFKLQCGSTNIAKKIGTNWFTFGIALLNDADGNTVDAICHKHGEDAEKINLEILRKWICGDGIKDRTWHGLLGALETGGCEVLADEMKQVLLHKRKVSGNHIKLVTQ